MRSPRLEELPAPPSGARGWPWTEESRDFGASEKRWPRVSIVTPSFNQAKFLEETIRSVLLQGYPDLEYIVLDGGSRDGSLEIIEKYAPWLAAWRSEPDGGQSAAINRGLEMATGEFATWINSDDMLCPNALCTHAAAHGFDTTRVYVGHCAYIDGQSRSLGVHRGRIRSLEELVRIADIWRAPGNSGQIDQPAVLFPRRVVLTLGGLDPQNHFTMDYELWGKLLRAGIEFVYTDVCFGAFRHHADQKTHDGTRQTRHLIETAKRLIAGAHVLADDQKAELLTGLDLYWQRYQENAWRNSGRLARIGLPKRVVVRLRSFYHKLQQLRRAETVRISGAHR